MIDGLAPSQQALYGTLFTWFVTALGSGVVFVEPLLPGSPAAHQLFLDTMLGFAGGVMIAASYWSLLAPAIAMAEQDWYGKTKFSQIELSNGISKEITYAWLPAAIGFAAGGVFLVLGDYLIGLLLASTNAAEAAQAKKDDSLSSAAAEGSLELAAAKSGSWRRILLLVFAITLHNIPEGLAVGVAFGGLGTETCKKLDTCSFEDAFNLALGIGIQNFPEGLAVSMPLRRSVNATLAGVLNYVGTGLFTSFFFGQLSGMVEPVAGVIGASAVQTMEPILPYAMAFAAGAMVFVVVDDLIPEAQVHGNGRAASLGCMGGFIVMMSLDVALG